METTLLKVSLLLMLLWLLVLLTIQLIRLTSPSPE